MTRRFIEDLNEQGNDVVAEDTYEVEIVDARALDGKAFAWLDLKILNGPDVNRTVTVGLNMPDDNAKRGAKSFFMQKSGAFKPVWIEKGVLRLADEDQPEAMATSIIGLHCIAELGIQKEGQYKGSQELKVTRQLGDGATSTGNGQSSTVSVRAVPDPAPAGDDNPPF